MRVLLVEDDVKTVRRGSRREGASRARGARRRAGHSLDQRARAFDRFWWSPTARRTRSGFGLELPIVRRLVDAAGGAVRLADAPGGGLGVVVVLPSAPRRAPVRAMA